MTLFNGLNLWVDKAKDIEADIAQTPIGDEVWTGGDSGSSSSGSSISSSSSATASASLVPFVAASACSASTVTVTVYTSSVSSPTAYA
jgi:hypothetical protein